MKSLFQQLFPREAAQLDRALALLDTLTAQGVKIMTQQEDLQKALDDIQAGVGKAKSEIDTLIADLQAHPAAPDLSPQIAQAQQIAASLAAIQAAPGA